MVKDAPQRGAKLKKKLVGKLRVSLLFSQTIYIFLAIDDKEPS